MGCGGSKEGEFVPPPVDENALKESAEMDEALRKQNEEENRIIKLLVLGTGESGKSTVFKQMKILYSVPDPPEKFLAVVRANLIGNAHAVAEGMDKLGIKYASPEAEAAGKLITSKPADGNVDASEFGGVIDALDAMYGDAGINESIERAAEYQLNDSTRYFWDKAKDILTSTYLPTEQDVLRARVRTTGIVQQNFQVGTTKYTMFDVGGQRNERRKWIHCFDNVTAVIFVTAISEYDQVLYEDENTNRMDEAVTLFDQICNHPNFVKTSMILFLNKRDLFEMKIKKKDLTSWRNTPEVIECGQDYDKCITYIKQTFIALNKSPQVKQVYVHATCATDTSNVGFVMESVFDVILKDNLRKMENVNVNELAATGAKMGGEVKYPASYEKGTIVLCACYIVDTLTNRDVLVESDDRLISVEVGKGKVPDDSPDWQWVQALPKSLPQLEVGKQERGSFQGNFKQAMQLLREKLGLADGDDLGFAYDTPIYMKQSDVTMICCVRSLPAQQKFGSFNTWKVFEDFENVSYPKHLGISDKNTAPDKNAEFDPFAANPVGHRWLKGITLYSAQVNRQPDKGVYLGIFKVLSTPTGFKVMVNEHNRIMIPITFLTENQMGPDELKWLNGVRVRKDKGEAGHKDDDMCLLSGKAPNRGWLGPEMSGEDGATLPEKLWWACDEAKARLNAKTLGSFYDGEVVTIDEKNNIQMAMFASIAKDEKDILDGHIWVDRKALEVDNMKYMCPNVLNSILSEQNQMMVKFAQVNAQLAEGGNAEQASQLRKDKEALKTQIEAIMKSQAPLKWVNRVILWVADKMPSFAAKVPGAEGKDAAAVVEEAIKMNTAVTEAAAGRTTLIQKYGK